jgi:CRISPR-associated protein Cmr2
MYAVVTNSNSYLDGIAKESAWIYHGGKKIEKDSLVIVYSPRGGETSAILPLKEYEGKRGVEVLIEIVNKINNGKFTNRLVYELYDEDNLLRWYQMIKNKDILIRDIISHAKRHVKDKQHAEEELKFLRDYLDKIYDAYYREIDDEEKMEIQKENYLFYQLFKSIRAYLGGLRGE